MKKSLIIGIALSVFTLVSNGISETITDLKNWTVEGTVQMDPAKPGPDGKPSIKVDPKGHAVLKLRDADGSGKLTLFVYDDATVASPDKQKSVGPRWGFTQADGRVRVGGIGYARYFAAEGSLTIIDTKPHDGWADMKFAGARGAAGWKKWEFEYSPDVGLKISVDGKPVAQKYFDWNASKAEGFNGLVLYGDATTSATPQSIWVSGISYELGAPMKVKPAGAGGAGASSSAPSAATAPGTAPSAAILNAPLLQTKETVVESAVASTASGSVADLGKWAVAGSVQMDPSKLGPDGKPSIKISPLGNAVLKLRDMDGSGKVTLYIYDDATVSVPDRQKSIGPRWGMTQANGRVLVGGVGYARFFAAEGSLTIVDTKPAKGWMEMKFAGARGAAGWKKWEFDYNADKGLTVSIDGKPILEKYFDWNTSQATGFNGIVLYGDATGSATPQTIWVSGIKYELGAQMKVRPASMADVPLPGEVKAVPFPGPTLAADLVGLKVAVAPSYTSTHPRLLFSAKDREALQQKAKENPELWSRVLDSARMVKAADGVMTPDRITSGDKYWRIEAVESGALAWLVTGDKEYRDGAIRWLVAYCREPMWGNLFRPNLDLAAAWNLYHVSIAYDILFNEINEADKKVIRDGLALHAKAIYNDLDPEDTQRKITYDQNHSYIPTVGMLAASLALVGEVPEAQDWLNRGYAVLRRSRYALGNDGYYYEGFGYWTYAMHWHVRAADLLARATGEKMHDIPTLRDNWMYALHMKLPGNPGAFNVHDGGIWDTGKPRPVTGSATNITMLWGVASATGSRGCQTAGNFYQGLYPEKDYPAAAFLWFNPAVKPLEMSEIKPYHYFPDHEVVSWRSSWKPDATIYLFRCGPPEGHEAAAKLGQMKDWVMNAGHVHPNIGAFWMYAKETYMAVDTGYTSKKFTRDHNTLVVDDKGQATDGTYHNERGVPYADLDKARIDCSYLGDAYGYASGEFGNAYNHLVPGVNLRRNILMTERWMLVMDEMNSEQDHKLSWYCHADEKFEPEGTSFVAHYPKASLAVVRLSSTALEAKAEPTTIIGGATLAETYPDKGRPVQRGYHLELTMAQPGKTASFMTLLVPLHKGDKAPEVKVIKQHKTQVELNIKWANGKTEAVKLDLTWKGSAAKTTEGPGPATIRLQ